MARVVNINGHIVPAEEAHVSAFDHGFLYGDGVYETLRTYEGVPFLLQEHLARLERSARRIRIVWNELPVQPAEELRKTLHAARNEESYIRIIVTRGIGPFGYVTSLCPRPTFMAYVEEFHPPPETLYSQGARAVIVTVRRNPSTALDPAIKSCNLLNNILAALEASEKGADEGLMLNVEGQLAEGSMTNVFLVRSGRILTPPLSAGILDGLTRSFLLSVCRSEGIPCDEVVLRPEDLFEAEECFMTSTTRELVPVVSVDGRPIGDGRPGRLTAHAHALFQRAARVNAGVHEGR